MRVIDIHVHLYPPELNAAPAAWALSHREPHWATLCTRVRRNGRPVQSFPTVSQMLIDMDQGGIERAVLLGWYWENHSSCLAQNRFFAECVRAHPDRLSAFAAFHPGAGREAVLSEIRWASDVGFVGLGELSPHTQKIPIDDPVLADALALAGELRLPVNLHVTEPNTRPYPGRVLTPVGDFVALAQRHSSTRFILAHWGARLPLDPVFGAQARACANLFYDAAASPLNYGLSVYREMIDAVGVERLLYGSDHPLNLYPQRDAEPQLCALLDDVAAAGLTAAERDALLAGNAARCLRL